MKRMLTALFFVMLILTACSTTTNEAGDSQSTGVADLNASEQLMKILKEATGMEADSLEKQFFLYYQTHNCELAMMPEFEKNGLPNWDNLTLFVLLNTDGRLAVDGTQKLTAEVFNQTAKRFFGNMEYSDKSSKYLTFKDGVYTAVPGDTARNGYFRLKEITAAGDEYTAVFDAFYFTDSDFTFDYEQATPNQRAVRDHAGTKDCLQPSDFASAILDIFESEDYSSALDADETVTITFALSDDPEYPLTYTSCSIQPLDKAEHLIDSTEAMSNLKVVLTGEEGFFDIGLEQELGIRDLSKVVSSDSTVTAEAKEFAVIDMDGDGTEEIILWLSVNGNDYYGYEILRYWNGNVYGYLIWYRAMSNLKEDATFFFSGGAADSGFGKLIFDDKTCSTERIAYSESGHDSDNRMKVSFFVNGEEVPKDIFETEIQRQDKKKDAIWYDFTAENIDKYVTIDFAELFASYEKGEPRAQAAETILLNNKTDALKYCMRQFDTGILRGLTFDSTCVEMTMYDFWSANNRLLLENIIEDPQQDWSDWSQYVKRMYDLNGYDETIFDETMYCERLYMQMLTENE